MRGVIICAVLLQFWTCTFADSLTLARNVEDLEFRLKRVEGNEQNYKLEKDLLKETYSNNFERVNLVITIALGVIGILGYLGIKDISSIKKEYEKELASLREIQSQFKLKSEELDKNKQKFEEDLKGIIKENEEQSKRIKFIELKEKIATLLKDNNLALALEFSNAALDLSKNDIDVLNQKGAILCRLNQITSAIEVFKTALALDPTNSTTILNTTECLFFGKEISEAKKLIEEHKSVYENKDNGLLLKFFEIIELYHAGNKDRLLSIAKGYVEFNNLKTIGKKINGWNLQEANYFVHYQPEGELKYILQNIVWYWDGTIDGETLLSKLKIDLPETPTK